MRAARCDRAALGMCAAALAFCRRGASNVVSCHVEAERFAHQEDREQGSWPETMGRSVRVIRFHLRWQSPGTRA